MTKFKTRKKDGQAFPLDRKTPRDSGEASFVGVDKSQIEYEPKSMEDYLKKNPIKVKKGYKVVYRYKTLKSGKKIRLAGYRKKGAKKVSKWVEVKTDKVKRLK